MTTARGGSARREVLLSGAVEHVLRAGAGTLSLRPLAAALGTSDRMLLYYFGTREQLLGAVLDRVGEQLRDELARALPSARVPPEELLVRTWEALRRPAAEAHLRLYVEVSGLATRGEEPFRAAAAAVAEAWLAWVASRLDVPEGEREDAAAGALAVLDGLLLVRFVAGPATSERAAGWISRLLPGAGAAGAGSRTAPP